MPTPHKRNDTNDGALAACMYVCLCECIQAYVRVCMRLMRVSVPASVHVFDCVGKI